MTRAVLLIVFFILLGAVGLGYAVSREQTALTTILTVVSVVVLVGALIAGAALSQTWAGRSFGPLAELKRLYATFEPQSVAPGDGVHFKFHTYYGLFLW